MIFSALFIFFLGLIFGSFISALSYRLPRGKSFVYGRSECVYCGKNIYWFDNIPLLSFILLKGRCRFCQRKISVRYPLIELGSGVLFLAFYQNVINCLYTSGLISYGQLSYICQLSGYFNISALPYLLVLSLILTTIFIIDLEYLIIPDSLVFLLLTIAVIVNLLSPASNFYITIFAGFVFSSFFLFLFAITKGKGMGLGDVKLVLAGGITLGWSLTFFWLTSSFIIGAVLGLILIFFKKARFGRPIAFGPFLVIGFFLTALCGGVLVKFLNLILGI